MSERDECEEAYAGKSFSRFHGTKCILPFGHEALLPATSCHFGRTKSGSPLRWYSVWQKELKEKQENEEYERRRREKVRW